MDDLSLFCCQNTECSGYGLRGEGNLSVCDRYGKDNQRRMLYCNLCRARFSERKGTVFFGAGLSKEKVASILEHLSEGCGVRKTERLVGVHRDGSPSLLVLRGRDEREPFVVRRLYLTCNTS